MFEEFDARSRTKIVRDADGVARALSTLIVTLLLKHRRRSLRRVTI